MNSVQEIHWFCLKSQPKHEHIAAAHLRLMKGVEVFAPRIRFQRATPQGARWFEEAMFPSYLFARFDFTERHREVRYAAGISSILQFGGNYARIEDSVINGLREHTDSEHVAMVQSDVKEGSPVKVVEGALRGLEAVVTQVLSGRERIRILVSFFGREINAEVGRSDVLAPRRHVLAA
jgi:transcriptional antiterminator RfaH